MPKGKSKGNQVAPLIEAFEHGIQEAPALGQAMHASDAIPPVSGEPPEIKTGQDLLDSHGFPADIVEAFSLTAKETNCVVMSRAPGGAVLELVKHGHDLKSYQIKAKSCDWGPMSGFLCQLPCFNKKGNAKIAYNDDNYIKYFKFIQSQQKHDEVFRRAIQAGQTAFIPLKLYDERVIGILDDPNAGIIDHKRLGNGDIVGIAAHFEDPKKRVGKTVVMEFMLKRCGEYAPGKPLWQVYHGRVVFKQKDKPNKWENFLEKKISTLLKQDGRDYELLQRKNRNARTVGSVIQEQPAPLANKDDTQPIQGEEARSVLNTYKGFNLELGGAGTDIFYPLCVAQNPYPPYKMADLAEDASAEAIAMAKSELYKNAVTGDYDLFAVWPVRPPIGWKDLLRYGDFKMTLVQRKKAQAAEKSLKERDVGFFLRVGSKRFALETRARDEMIIEVIPGYDELGIKEDTEIGNINSAVAEVVQYLNAFIFSVMLEKVGGTEGPQYVESEEYNQHKENVRKHFAYPNAAFHSDEGGRPGIDEIDFPVAVFLPPSLISGTDRNMSKYTVFEEHEYARFLNVCLALRSKCFVMFNHVWINRLFALVAKSSDLKKAPKSAEKYFKEVAEERESLTDIDLKFIRVLLSRLFLNGQLRVRFEARSSTYWGGVDERNNQSEVAMSEKSMDILARQVIQSTGKKQAKDIRNAYFQANITIPDRTPTPDTAETL
ncbi:anthrax toxin-like adenylyl cyclase domain-containing protein [Neptunomonas sp.]|uniref:anthrax toxin-like adenylyl cyclase domain-containing protein n=1 Tax=Neptunomonas sp. TaxID=1971898 RepID=UPI0035634375